MKISEDSLLGWMSPSEGTVNKIMSRRKNVGAGDNFDILKRFRVSDVDVGNIPAADNTNTHGKVPS